MNNLVTINDAGIAVTTSLKIANGVGNSHATVIKLVRNNRKDFEEFGRVGFEIVSFETTGGRQKREIAILNEAQATLLMTYMCNNDVVRMFKKALVKAFYELKKYAVDHDRDTRFDLPSYWDEMRPAEKALYVLGPINKLLVEAFRLDVENKNYKALIKEAQHVLDRPVAKAV
ncbi:Rha family transcriptional regulator [Bartonella sp. CB178]|uniref:Rha family transcriptional regulator n=1 Tax=Bartonella sp. CB178 TaxID=3112255 RepID=UPI00300E3B66